MVAVILQIQSTSKCRSYARNGTDTGFVPESAAPIALTVQSLHEAEEPSLEPARIKLRHFVVLGRSHLAKSLVDHPACCAECAHQVEPLSFKRHGNVGGNMLAGAALPSQSLDGCARGERGLAWR